MTWHVLTARIILGLWLLITGLIKLPDLKGFAVLVRSYGGTAAKYPFMAYGIPFAEIVLGAGLLIGYQLKWVAVASLIMLLIYTYGVAKMLIQKKKMDNCGCFGTMIKVPLSKWSLIEDLVCIALAVIILVSI